MILNTKPSIVFVSAFNAPFIQDDLDFLEKNFTVNKQIGHGMLAVLKIIFAVLQCDLVFCWFASVYAVIGVAVGRILGVKSLVVVGGVDVAREKELNYGIWLSTWRATLVGYGLRNAHQVLVVDPSLKEDAVRLADYDGRNILYLATGYDSTFWRPVGEKEPTVLTVAVAREENRLKLKGIDVLVEVARRLPSIEFIVIGVDPELGKRLGPSPNITFRDHVRRLDLLPFYQRSKVYCQPSRREGLPNALCEAMLCGCIPVATEVGGNRSALGDTGILVPPADPDSLAAAVRQSLQLPEGVGLKARARIISLYSRQKRETELLHIINSLTA